jgi:hypothetical protein
MIAPAMAANSSPPSRRSMSNGSLAAERWRATASADGAFRRERDAGDAGSEAGPQLRRAAEETGAQRCRGGGAPDPHLAERQRVDAGFYRHHAVGHRLGREDVLRKGNGALEVGPAHDRARCQRPA